MQSRQIANSSFTLNSQKILANSMSQMIENAVLHHLYEENVIISYEYTKILSQKDIRCRILGKTHV